MRSTARSFGPLLLVTSVFGLVVACGSSDSTFQDGDDSLNGAASSSGFGGNGEGSSGSNGSSGNGGGDTCVADETLADLAPAYLFFLFDVSGSMGRQGYGNPDQKWNPVTTAFKGFVGSERSTGISASLTLFPNLAPNMACEEDAYKTPNVPLTALPNESPFSSALPDPDGLGTPTEGTPTLYALKGLLPGAREHAQKHPDAKTVVVLVTDGEPRGCSGNNINAIGELVEEYASVVPTYVIGVGTAVNNLNKIAEKGGTKEAIRIDVGNPTETQKQFADTIDAIRRKSLSCELAIPQPPDGQTLDLNKVNVSYTPSGGTKQALSYDAKCGAGGWRFDDEASPTKIVLCDSVCDSIKADPRGRVAVEFGCARRDGPK